MTRLSLPIALAAALALFAGSTQAAPSKTPTLYGTVGPGFTITLKTAAGKTVKTVAPGTYNFVINDKGPIHDFHLFGPGVNKATGIAFTGKVTWKGLKLKKASTYKYHCDVHRTIMHGSFKTT